MGTDGRLPRRTRRSTAEVQRLILAAATTVFARKGYATATTDDIAAEAGVARSVMFRHFTSKAELFRAAELQPFVDMVTTFKETLAAQMDELWSDEQQMRTMVEFMYDSFRTHRAGVLAIAASHARDPETDREAQAVLNDAFDAIVILSEVEIRRRGWAPLPRLDLSIRTVIGMIAAMSALDPLFLPGGDAAPTREQIVDHLTEVALHGIQSDGRAADPATGR